MKEETIEEAAERLCPTDYGEKSKNIINMIKLDAFVSGIKWQQERSYSREEIFPLVDMLDQCKDYFFLKKDKNTVDAIADIFKKLKIK